ncbi:ABC transporter ATP-binding protein [Staphylococcus equorum]|uniref:ABC transporter ATP-binding protein n=1 Tax=Staphylococcus equorum TaxID=246432 RepID=UPI003A82B12B
MSNIFKLNDINKFFGKNKVLDSINLSIDQGEIVGLLGLNGQGKSTLIKILLGLLKQSSGTITRNIDFKQQCGVVLQDIAIPEKMKVIEWLNLLKAFSNEKQDIDKILNQVDLLQEKDKYCSNLSGGQQRRLQYAASLVNNPDFLVLDEPTAGMDIASQELFWDNIYSKVKKEQLSVFLISHDLDEIEEFATRIIILDAGKIILDKNVAEIFKNPKNKHDKLKKIFKEKVTYAKH